MKTLIMDMDGILTEFNRYTLDNYNKTYNTSYQLDFCDYLIGDSNPIEGIEANKIIQLFKIKDYFFNMPPKEGALEGMNTLKKFFNIYIGTKIIPGVSSGTYSEKEAWINKYLPEFTDKILMTTGSKANMFGDILVDDAAKNQTQWKAIHPNGVVASLKYPWTLKENVDIIAGNWQDLSKILALCAGSEL